MIFSPLAKEKKGGLTVGYLTNEEYEIRIQRVRGLLTEHGLDIALVYYDEFNIGNGWYLTGWCPQFESGAVLKVVDVVRRNVSFSERVYGKSRIALTCPASGER